MDLVTTSLGGIHQRYSLHLEAIRKNSLRIFLSISKIRKYKIVILSLLVTGTLYYMYLHKGFYKPLLIRIEQIRVTFSSFQTDQV